MTDNEPYYFPVSGVMGDECTQRCLVKDNGIMIGSAKCQECEHMLEMGKPYKDYLGPDWIVCERLNEAINGK